MLFTKSAGSTASMINKALSCSKQFQVICASANHKNKTICRPEFGNSLIHQTAFIFFFVILSYTVMFYSLKIQT